MRDLLLLSIVYRLNASKRAGTKVETAHNLQQLQQRGDDFQTFGDGRAFHAKSTAPHQQIEQAKHQGCAVRPECPVPIDA